MFLHKVPYRNILRTKPKNNVIFLTKHDNFDPRKGYPLEKTNLEEKLILDIIDE